MPVRDESGLTKYIVPALIGLCFTLVGAGVIGSVAMSNRLARLEASRQVQPEDVVALRVELQNLKEKGQEVHAQQDEELERLRTWLRNHTHNGQVKPTVTMEAPSPSNP